MQWLETFYRFISAEALCGNEMPMTFNLGHLLTSEKVPIKSES